MSKQIPAGITVGTIWLSVEERERIRAICARHDWTFRTFMRRAAREKIGAMEAAG